MSYQRVAAQVAPRILRVAQNAGTPYENNSINPDGLQEIAATYKEMGLRR
jgi:hypothetical protein